MKKILLINTFPQYGGASLACQRLFEALKKHTNLEVKILNLYQNQNPNQINPQQGISNTFFQKNFTKYKFMAERLQVRLAIKNKKYLYSFSPASQGWDISTHAWVQEADVLHLHWINFGFLSLKSLKKLFKLNKPIVWTMHDLWAVTGGCHYAGDCKGFENACGNCPMLYFAGKKDWSNQLFVQKFRLFYNQNIHWVGCSRWIAEEAHKSSIIKRSIHSDFLPKVSAIPNPIDTEVFFSFSPEKKQQTRQKLGLPADNFLILFGAMNIQDERKGFDYLVKSLYYFKEFYLKNEGNKTQQEKAQQEKIQENRNKNIALMIFGKTPKNLPQLPFEVCNLGVLKGNDALCEAYNCADLFVLPSLEDNLPNTLMETLACGTPAVGFDVGGIPEMITHQKSGYIARYKDVEDFAKGIDFCVNYPNHTLQIEARKQVLEKFSEKKVAQQYQEIYLNK